MKINKIKEALAKILASFNEVSTDKGILVWRSENELPEVDENVFFLNEDGEEVVAEDGEYRTETNYVIVVEDGKVKEVRDLNSEKEVEEEETREEEFEGEFVEPEIVVVPESEVPGVDEEEEHRLDDLEKRVSDLERLVLALVEKINVVENEPAAEPASEEYKKVNQIKSTSDEKMNKLSRILNATW